MSALTITQRLRIAVPFERLMIFFIDLSDTAIQSRCVIVNIVTFLVIDSKVVEVEGNFFTNALVTLIACMYVFQLKWPFNTGPFFQLLLNLIGINNIPPPSAKRAWEMLQQEYED